MLTPLMETLQTAFGFKDVSLAYIEVQTIFRALQHQNFLKNIPKFLNGRTTNSNIRLIIASVVLIQEGKMSFKDIRKGIKAFELMVFSLNDELEENDH